LQRKVYIECPCGKVVETIPANKETKKYCSQLCKYKYMPKNPKKTYIVIVCKTCGKRFSDWKANNRSYCSMKCRERNKNWKGDAVSYSALHSYITRKLGTPNKCEHCSTQNAKKFEWANISGEYKRDLDDWVRLCTSCHSKYDDKPNKRKRTIGQKYGN